MEGRVPVENDDDYCREKFSSGDIGHYLHLEPQVGRDAARVAGKAACGCSIICQA
ncbi:hypothetical protein FHT91_004144 [Rhizobium sp. BK347]|nr:hypothetical protein [Rhizobium sp. BK252]MBB3403889.1 hypothetical protein [Rhizobium sp. BK289]MBB3416442.1 hypothetical protein [Rhizobium sp. BK284]MBB3484352.1 hypothetical protein [Rhizobium sp. BK347]